MIPRFIKRLFGIRPRFKKAEVIDLTGQKFTAAMPSTDRRVQSERLERRAKGAREIA